MRAAPTVLTAGNRDFRSLGAICREAGHCLAPSETTGWLQAHAN